VLAFVLFLVVRFALAMGEGIAGVVVRLELYVVVLRFTRRVARVRGRTAT
jgi:hypothetical protein